MKKCWSCGATKGLKQMNWDLCSDEFLEGREHGSTCKNCYGELGCPYEHGIISECIEHGLCPDSQKYKDDLVNWDKTDYHFKTKLELRKVNQ